MTIRALLTGKLFRPAEAKTSSSGKPYAVATIALDGQPDGAPRYARITLFGSDAEAVLTMPKGAAVAVAGRLECSIWAPEGKPAEVALRLVVDAVLTVGVERSRSPERQRQPAQDGRHGDDDGLPV